MINATMKNSIAWYSRSPETPRQVDELKRLYGDETVVEHRGSPNNAKLLREDFEQSGAQDCVVVGPMAYLEHVLHEGIQPLWSQMEPCDKDDPAVEIRLGDGRCFKFIEFRRLKELRVEYAGVLEALRHTRPAVVAWLSRHAPTRPSREELQRLYGKDVNIRVDGAPFRNANEVMDRSRGAHDRVLVAPLSVLDDLTKRGIQPIEPKLIEGNRVILRRVLGVKMEFDPVTSKSDTSRKEITQPKDILSLVHLTPAAVQAYQAFAWRLAVALQAMSIVPHEIPDEQGQAQPDGSLLVYVDLPQGKGRLEFRIPAGEWAWADRN